MSLRIVFMGTPAFAVPCLQALVDSGQDVVAVYTQPDRPAGRGRKLTAPPVKVLAEKHGIPVHQPASLKKPDAQAALAALKPDLMIVVAYGLILSQAVLDIPRLDCINVHASLLPRWRGAAPIQHAILSGDKASGVTIMQVTKGLDEGPMLHKVECPLDENTTGQSLHDELSTLGANALSTVLTQFDKGTVTRTPQDDAFTTYAAKMQKHDAALDWDMPAETLSRWVRAYQPWPVAFTYLGADPIRVWGAVPIDQTTQEKPGTIIKANKTGIDVATAKGVLRLTVLQFPGSKALPVSEVLKSRQDLLRPGTLFGSL